MRTFLLLASLSPQGLQTLATTPERLFEVNREIERLGGRVVRQWALLGAYDFLSEVEAPDGATVARITIELASRGSATFETMVAIPVRRVHRVPGVAAGLSPGRPQPAPRHSSDAHSGHGGSTSIPSFSRGDWISRSHAAHRYVPVTSSPVWNRAVGRLDTFGNLHRTIGGCDHASRDPSGSTGPVGRAGG